MKKSSKWISWGILVFGFVLVFFHRIAISSVSDLLKLDLGLDSIQLANLASMTFYGYALMQLPVGIFVDTIGVKKICTIGMIVTAIGSVMFGFSDHVYIAYFARFLVGIGTSVIIVSVMKVQSTLFPSNMYSSLSGLTSLFGNFGAFFATIPLTIIASTFGWRETFIILGIISVILAVSIFLFVKDKEEQKDKTKKVKEEKINIKEGVLFVLKNKKIWSDFFIMVFFVGSITAILGVWGSGYLKNVYNLDSEKAAYYISFVIYGFIIGSPIIGKVSDLLGGEIKKILLIASSGYVLIWSYILIIQSGKPPINQLPIIFFLMGLTIICHILVFSNVKEINPLKYTGIAISIINIGEFVGSGIIASLMGIIIKKLTLTGMAIDKVYITAMILVLISAVLSLISVITMHDKKSNKSATRISV